MMAKIKAFFKTYPVLTYFALTFIISWGGLFLGSGGAGGFPKSKEQFERMLPLFIPVLLAGPSLAGILLTGLVSGRAGFNSLFSRLLKWRVGLRWYAVALLIGPLVLMTVLLALSQFFQAFIPGILVSNNKASLLSMGIVAGLVVGFFEELGWTGFATPQLRLRYSVVRTGLIVGVLWGAWHVFLNVVWVSGAYSGELPPALFLTGRGLGDLVGLLPAFRILMVWVYDRTGSLMVAMLMHAGLTASTMILEPPAISGVNLLIYDLVSALAMWAVVAVIALAMKGNFSNKLKNQEQSKG